MSHLLILEVPGGNDFDLVEAALAQGHDISFFTADRAHYERRPSAQAALARMRNVVEIRPFDYARLEAHALAIHAQHPFEAVLCLIDIRLPDAARLAHRLGLRFMAPELAVLLRDKYSVRKLLAEKGILQPDFALALDNQQLRQAIAAMGLPVLVKPSDGYGSQNISTFLTDDDLNPLIDPLDHYLPCRSDYGFGVTANDRLLVERFIPGQLIGCDTLSQDGRHVLLGINEKLMYPHPSRAIRGSCFPCDKYDTRAIETYVFAILDALRYNDGMTHTEIMLSAAGPMLIEVNPRMVGAQIARLLNLALDRSLHVDLINLHLGKPLALDACRTAARFAVSRWFCAPHSGILQAVKLPPREEPGICHVEVFKRPGDEVGPVYQNADRIGYVMTLASTREDAERLADTFLEQVEVSVTAA